MASVNNQTILNAANFLGLETVDKASQPILEFLEKSRSESMPNSEGSFVERYLDVMQKNKERGNTDSAFYGHRGNVHLQSTLLDLFVAGLSIIINLCFSLSIYRYYLQELIPHLHSWSGPSCSCFPAQRHRQNCSKRLTMCLEQGLLPWPTDNPCRIVRL